MKLLRYVFNYLRSYVHVLFYSINLVIIRRRILEELNKSDKAKIGVASHNVALPRGTGRQLTDDDDLYKPLRVNINSAQVKKKIKKVYVHLFCVCTYVRMYYNVILGSLLNAQCYLHLYDLPTYVYTYAAL